MSSSHNIPNANQPTYRPLSLSDIERCVETTCKKIETISFHLRDGSGRSLLLKREQVSKLCAAVSDLTRLSRLYTPLALYNTCLPLIDKIKEQSTQEAVKECQEELEGLEKENRTADDKRISLLKAKISSFKTNPAYGLEPLKALINCTNLRTSGAGFSTLTNMEIETLNFLQKLFEWSLKRDANLIRPKIQTRSATEFQRLTGLSPLESTPPQKSKTPFVIRRKNLDHSKDRVPQEIQDEVKTRVEELCCAMKDVYLHWDDEDGQPVYHSYLTTLPFFKLLNVLFLYDQQFKSPLIKTLCLPLVDTLWEKAANDALDRYTKQIEGLRKIDIWHPKIPLVEKRMEAILQNPYYALDTLKLLLHYEEITPEGDKIKIRTIKGVERDFLTFERNGMDFLERLFDFKAHRNGTFQQSAELDPFIAAPLAMTQEIGISTDDGSRKRRSDATGNNEAKKLNLQDD